MRTLVVLAALIILFLIFKSFSKSSPQFAKKMLTRLAIGAAIVLFLFLLATGRMHWLFALVAAAIPLLRRMLPLIRYLPWLRKLYSQQQASTSTRHRPNNGHHSTVQSRYLSMGLDHDSGNMDGEILMGSLQGQQLSNLSLGKLIELYQELKTDSDSLALLQTYLDRYHTGWEKHTNSGQRAQDATPSNHMTTEEAREILGISDSASQEEIVAAHRRLMQKVHPDHGGSTYLAAKINLAKDHLISS